MADSSLAKLPMGVILVIDLSLNQPRTRTQAQTLLNKKIHQKKNIAN